MRGTPAATSRAPRPARRRGRPGTARASSARTAAVHTPAIHAPAVRTVAVRIAALVATLLAALPATLATAQALAPEGAQARAVYLDAERARVATYAAALDALPAAMAADLPANLTPFLGWRDERARRYARLAADVEEGREASVAPYWRDLAATTDAWTEWLAAVATTYGADAPPIADPRRTPDAWNGRWVDGYGGVVSARRLDAERILLRVEVVRGGHRHTGLLAGVADLAQDGTRATLERTTELGGERVTTTLTATFLDGGLNVATVNAWPWHGVEAYFRGRYLRSGPLDADARARLERDAAPNGP